MAMTNNDHYRSRALYTPLIMDMITMAFCFFCFQIDDSSLQVGAAVSLSNLIGLLQENESKSTSFKPLADHLLKIANVPVRNVGSWAGNLMLTHDHDNFPSDVFTMMAGVGAKVTIGELCMYCACLALILAPSSVFQCCRHESKTFKYWRARE